MDMNSTAMAGDDLGDAGVLRDRADMLRDAREWEEAAQLYAAYLQLMPEDWAIWVQYGHCMKESGDLRGALLLYREAERQQAADPDIQVQIGHVLKLLGRTEEAFEAYARALELDPGHGPARAEIMPEEAAPSARSPAAQSFVAQSFVAQSFAAASFAGQSFAGPSFAGQSLLAPSPMDQVTAAEPPRPMRAPSAVSTAGHAIVFDASDLFQYFRHNRAPTGIQRVQLNIIGAALAEPGEAAIAIAAFDPGLGLWKSIAPELFHRLAWLAGTGMDPEEPDWQMAVAAMAEALRLGPAIAFAPGSTLVNLGTSWWLPDYLRRIRQAKADSGLRYIPFLHDCVPLLVPEHCAASLVEDFARWFAGVCLHADALLVNSACTRRDVLAAQRRLLPGLELASTVITLDAATPPAAALPPLPGCLRTGRPFVLFVGTIESRKNHLLAFNAWLALVRKHGADAVPDLVCVGKRGWLAEAALTLHANSATLQAKVHLLHDVPDPLLEALYTGCVFTLYNSYYEGWGLPVTESIAHGKVPLVPRHSSLLEAGGEAAVFFTPQSEPDLVAQLERLMLDTAWRAEREALIAALPRPRPWSAVAADILEFAARAAGEPTAAPLTRLRLRLGEMIETRLIRGTEPALAMAAADAVRDGAGWHALEAWGVPTGPGACRLRLPVEDGAGAARLRVYLDLLAPEAPVRFALRARVEGEPAGPFREVSAAAEERLVAVLEVTAAGGDVVEVEIETLQAAARAGSPPRQAGVGVRSVMLCRRDDWGARMDYLERAVLPRMISA